MSGTNPIMGVYKNLDKVKKKLMDRKYQLEQELVELYSENVLDDQVKDLGDQALSSTMESLRSSLQDREIEEYNMICQVLARIESGEYGTCVDCAQPISEKRLSVYVNATRCLACQEAMEG